VLTEEFPDLALEHMLVDNCAMQLMLNPSRFDVIVTDNMFGDILSDEAAVLTGSIGLLPSASLGSVSDDKPTRPGLYEPVHGSAPDLAGTNAANPIGMILSVAMLLRHSFSLVEEARAIEDAVSLTVTENVRTRDLGGTASTTQVTDRVIDNLLLEGSSSAELHPTDRDLASFRHSSHAPQ
jgi:3-isopropylmalate dehydrogenase